MRFSLIKKLLILIAAAGLLSLSIISPLRSQGSGDIVVILTQILQRVDKLPQFMKAWTDPDDSDASAAMVGTFQQLGQLLPKNMDTQMELQGTLNNYLLSNNKDSLDALNAGTSPTGKPPTASTMKYANDLTYSSLLGAPFYAKDPREKTDSAMNYIMNASGANIYHEMPTGGFHGKEGSKNRYQSFYNTIMAATSFNNYVLSYDYADKNQFTTLQKTLIQQATNGETWFTKVGSENIGFVLRQLLMYQSQTFVLLTQMIQLQKQMVSAQAVNTAVLIANGQMTEASMAAYARGDTPEF